MTPSDTQESPQSLRKAAILVTVLDTRSADGLLDKMGSQKAAQVRSAIMELGDVSSLERKQVVAEFLRAGTASGVEAEAGIELDDSLARRFATAPPCQHDETPSDSRDGEPPPFRFLHEATSDALAKHLQREHPQVVAVVVAHLPPKRAADLITRLPDRLQVDVLRRVAELDVSDPEILRDLEEELELLLSDEIRAARNRSAGLSAVASILNAAGTDRTDLLQNVARHDGQLMSLLSSAPAAAPASERPAPREKRPRRDHPRHATPAMPDRHPAQKRLEDGAAAPPATTSAERKDVPHGADPVLPETETTRIEFDDLIRFDDHSLAVLFGAADSQLTLLALTGASEELVARIMKPLTGREAKSLRRRMERQGPLRLADVEQAQRDLARLASQLADRGAIQHPDNKRFAVAV